MGRYNDSPTLLIIIISLDPFTLISDLYHDLGAAILRLRVLLPKIRVLSLAIFALKFSLIKQFTQLCTYLISLKILDTRWTWKCHIYMKNSCNEEKIFLSKPFWHFIDRYGMKFSFFLYIKLIAIIPKAFQGVIFLRENEWLAIELKNQSLLVWLILCDSI